MALLAVQEASRAGLNMVSSSPSSTIFAASASGDRFTNTGKEMLMVYCAGGGITVTCETTLTVDGQAVADNAVALTASVPSILGPFPVSDYGTEVLVTYSGVANVFLQVIRVTPV